MKKNITKTKNYRIDVETNLFFIRISSVIFQARNEKKMSQVDLAKAVGTTQRIISIIEDADIDYNMGLNLLYRIFNFLEIKMIIDNKNVIMSDDNFNSFSSEITCAQEMPDISKHLASFQWNLSDNKEDKKMVYLINSK